MKLRTEHRALQYYSQARRITAKLGAGRKPSGVHTTDKDTYLANLCRHLALSEFSGF
jgi:hypothetical protein